jgi:hypothetical protein
MAGVPVNDDKTRVRLCVTPAGPCAEVENRQPVKALIAAGLAFAALWAVVKYGPQIAKDLSRLLR